MAKTTCSCKWNGSYANIQKRVARHVSRFLKMEHQNAHFVYSVMQTEHIYLSVGPQGVPLECLISYTPMCGPIESASMERARYFITFIDYHSKQATVSSMEHKADAKACYLQFDRMAEPQTGRLIRAVRSNRAGEYLCYGLEDRLWGIQTDRQLTILYSSHEIWVAEGMNWTLLESIKSMSHCKGLQDDCGQNLNFLWHMLGIELILELFL